MPCTSAWHRLSLCYTQLYDISVKCLSLLRLLTSTGAIHSIADPHQAWPPVPVWCLIDMWRCGRLREGLMQCLCLLQEGNEEDDDRWVMEQVGKGARSVPSASAISSLNLNGR